MEYWLLIAVVMIAIVAVVLAVATGRGSDTPDA